MTGPQDRAVRIEVLGRPVPQGSKRHIGRGILVESSNTKPWREAIKTAAVEAMIGRPRLDGPVEVTATFYFDRPRSHYGTGRNADTLKPSAPAYPATRAQGDIEKLVRCANDALTDAGVWHDDSQVVLLVTWKQWTNGYALLPGLRLIVRPI